MLENTIENSRLRLPKWYKEFTVSAAILLILVQLAFLLVQSQIAQKADTAVTSILTGTNAFLSPYYLSQASAGLEAGGLVRCVKIKKSGKAVSFYESVDENCSGGVFDRILLAGERMSSEVKSANGEAWEITFRAQNGTLFYLALWVLRILVVAMVAIMLSRNELRLQSQRGLEESRLAAALDLANLAGQVSHDIRSPLAALESALAEASGISEDQKNLVSAAATRIREIANDLLSHGHVDSGLTATGEIRIELLSALLSSIVDEKRVEYRENASVQIVSAPISDKFYIAVSHMEFKRVISNLINNAVEATERGKVEIKVVDEGDNLLIQIHDEGKGMSSKTLHEIGRRGFTYGKPKGSSGLGVYYARERIRAWSGEVEINSAENRGTLISLRLPKARPLEKSHELSNVSVLLDDDLAMHTLWKISARRAERVLECYSRPSELVSRLESLPKCADIFVDVYLGEREVSGVEFSKKLVELGFQNVYLTTGSRPEKFEKMSWIRKILGKSPPW